MDVDELRERRDWVRKLIYLEENPGAGADARARLESRLRQTAARIDLDADPAGWSPAEIVSALRYGSDLSPERRRTLEEALRCRVAERYRPESRYGRAVLRAAGLRSK